MTDELEEKIIVMPRFTRWLVWCWYHPIYTGLSLIILVIPLIIPLALINIFITGIEKLTLTTKRVLGR